MCMFILIYIHTYTSTCMHACSHSSASQANLHVPYIFRTINGLLLKSHISLHILSAHQSCPEVLSCPAVFQHSTRQPLLHLTYCTIHRHSFATLCLYVPSQREMPTTLTGRGYWLRRNTRGQIRKHTRPQ